MICYNDYSCKKIANDYYLVFLRKEDGTEEEVGGFTNGELFIYPKFKGISLGYVIRLFMKDNGAV
ncbi:MAG: hypothetical protein EBU90_01075 [Proteobacteria bacterium]|nr:hypothetical protein [Pseudomonadota bacterium]NBP13015.1 hypothetical protein [bacterium]